MFTVVFNNNFSVKEFWSIWKSLSKDETCIWKMKKLSFALLTLMLVSSFKTANEYQVNPSKPSYNLRKRKKTTPLQEIPRTIQAKKKKRSQKPEKYHKSKDER